MKPRRLLTNWNEILEAGSARSGGKGWHLARLARYGLPVPEILVIPVEEEQEWLAGCEPPDLAEAPLDEKSLQRLDGFHRQLLTRPFPDALHAILHQALARKGWLEQPLAVRSSATAEDSFLASFAGIHLSRLSLTGLPSVIEGVREVWASRWLPQAVAYRQRVGLSREAVAMGVVIMPMVEAVASGIAFTCDPLNGRDDRLVLHAHWGLGETLVTGEARGDEILLAEHSHDPGLELLDYRKGDKAVMSLPAPHGTRRQTTPREMAEDVVFSRRQALKLGRLVWNAAIALDFSNPYFDLEWVWDGKRFWLVQARPVTARGRHTYPSLLSQPDIWSRGNTCEVTPYPLSVYDWFNSRRLINLMLERAPALAGYPLLPGIQRAGLFNGRLYLNLSLLQWELHDAFGLAPEAINTLMGGHQPEIEVAPPGLMQRVSRVIRLIRFTLASRKFRRQADEIIGSVHDRAKAWRRQVLPESEPELLAALREQIRYTRSLTPLFLLQTSSGGSLSMLADLIDKYLPGEGHALGAAILAGGEPSVTAQQAYDLADLARIAVEDTAASVWLEEPRYGDDWQATLPEKSPFRAAFARFLERYGHRAVYETYFRHPRWREAPGYLFDTIKGLTSLTLEALRLQQRSAAEAARRRVKAQLPFWLQPMLKSLTKAATREVNHREAARSALVALMEPQRRILLEIARHWRERGVEMLAEDIFELALPEIQSLVEGEIPPEGLLARLQERKQQRIAWEDRTPNEVILQQADGRQKPQTPETATPTGRRSFQGMAVGTGRANGRLRILRSPAEGPRLKPGEVLAAPSTDPSWTPLFLKAGGLIMETGGYLSHGAIVAREFGIPAVVNLPGILEQLNEGERVEVDGHLGRVTRLEE